MCGISGSIINLNPEIKSQNNLPKIFGLINDNSFYKCYKEVTKLRSSNTYLKLGFYKDYNFKSKLEKIRSELNKKRSDKMIVEGG